MSTKPKRKHIALTLQEKMELLNRIGKGENMAQLASEYGVGRATLHHIKSKRSQIEEHVKRMEGSLDNRKTMKGGLCPEMEMALYVWFLRQRVQQAPVTGELLKTKAVELFKKLTSKDNFRASDGWLDNFKKRFGIRYMPIPAKTPPFMQSLQEKIEALGLNPAQVYTTKQSCLFWKQLPKQSFSTEERIRFMLCTNTSGTHKFDLMVIGKQQHPPNLENISSLPVFYSNHPESLITGEILSQWFQYEFVPKVRNYMRRHNLPEKAILILDATTDHTNAEDLKSSDGMIETVIMPSNSTSTPSLMDDNIVLMIKSLYKKKLLINIFSQGGDIAQTIQEVNMKNAVFSLAQSWDSISTDMIRSFWKTLWPSTNAPIKDEADTAEDLPVEIWTDFFAEFRILADEVICKEEIEPSSSELSVTNDEALECFNKCITWAEENGVSTNENMVLRNLREKVFKQGLADLIQQYYTE